MKKFFKTFNKWGDSRTWLETAGWCVWAGSLAVMASSYPIAAAFGFIALLACMGLSIHQFKKLPIYLLIGSLLLCQTSFSEPQRPKPNNSTPECNAIIIGGVVIVVGGIILYNVIKFCKKHFPPPPPPPPPPTPGTNSPATNNPSPFPAVAMQPSYEPTSCDISGDNWVDNTVAGNPVPFQDFITLSFSSSSDLKTWTNCCTINLWLSSNSVESVIYDWNGQPLGTNYTPGNPYSQSLTSRLPLPVDTKRGARFFRDY